MAQFFFKAADASDADPWIADAGIVVDDNDLTTLPVVVMPKNTKHPGVRIVIVDTGCDL